MAVNDLYELTVYLSSSASAASLVFGYRQNTGTNDADTLQSAVEFWAANDALVLAACLSTQVRIDEVKMVGITALGEIEGIQHNVPVFGTRTGSSLPFTSAAVITKVTNAPNARHNGRVFIPGVSEDDTVDGTIVAALIALLVIFGDQMEVELQTSLPQTARFEPVTISRTINGVPRVPIVGFDVISTTPRPTMHQQRRRLTRRRGTTA